MISLTRFSLLSLLYFAASSSAFAADPSHLNVAVEGIENGKRIPDINVVCLATPEGKSDKTGKNLRPTIDWSGAPATAKSFAIFVMDPDVPADFSAAGKEGKVIAADVKRRDFFHYAVVNIPAETTSFLGGAAEVKPAVGTQLSNDIGTNHYVASPEQFGGPCPPWNDERLHHYHFMVLALDAVADAGTTMPKDTAKLAYDRLIHSPHLVAKGEVVGTYALNPNLK